MSTILEALAVIKGKDATGDAFAKVEQKIKGVASAAKSLEGVKPFQGGNFTRELAQMKATERELAHVSRSFKAFDAALKSNGPMRASRYFEAVDIWKGRTLSALREVRGSVAETDRVQERFFRHAARFAVHAAGIGGGAYVAGHATRGGVHSAAERERELTRLDLAGLAPDEKDTVQRRADDVARRNPTVGRTEIIDHILKLRGRFGDLHHALDAVEDVIKAQTVLKTLGAVGAGKDLEDLTLGLESQGVSTDPAKFKSYLDSFVRAKMLFPQVRGDDVRQYMQRASASRYGLSDDYLKNVVPTLANAEGWSNFGVQQGSAFSALIGGRQTRAAKAAMAHYGLLGKDGEIVDKPGFIANPYHWTIDHVKGALADKGVPMDSDHRGELVEAVTKMFSNRKVADFISSILINEGLVEKDRAQYPKTPDIHEGAEIARRDPFQAANTIVTQLNDAAAAMLRLQPIVGAINVAADKLSGFVSDFSGDTPAGKTGKMLGLGIGGAGAAAGGVLAARGAYQWFVGAG
ncbi:MAG: hypothetical protein JSS22_02875, partial [Proteobacteria bacterium]|nr:hypothetical protein [Pseudomonadota bacterium]